MLPKHIRMQIENDAVMADFKKDLLCFLENQIEKANKFGKECNLKDNDINRALAWYSAAEALTIVKEKIYELSSNLQGNAFHCPSCNAIWDLSQHNSCQCGATVQANVSYPTDKSSTEGKEGGE